jgi:molybdopterin adenylyltransferase
MTLPTGTTEHRAAAAGQAPIDVAIVIVSDSRTIDTDESGPLAQRLFEAASHRVVDRTLLPNVEVTVRAYVESLLARADVSVVLLSGGTGLGRKDCTVEAVRPLVEKELPGFGEIFRMISYQEQIGTAAILTRAFAGTVNGKLIVSLPGAKAAVELALTKVLLPEIQHLMHELRR